MDHKSYLKDWNDLMKTAVGIEGLNDIYKSIAEEIGFENTVAVYNMFRGTQVSFPRSLCIKRLPRNTTERMLLSWHKNIIIPRERSGGL